VKATSIKQSLGDVRISLVRARLGLARAIFETGEGVLMVAVDPLIGGFSADAVVEAKFCDGLRLTKEIGDKLSLVVHR
jgi:hypothetical protein